VDNPVDRVPIRRDAIDAVVSHALRASPSECCGLLVGRKRRIVGAIETRNAAVNPTSRFLIDPKDHIDQRREARRRGLDVIGFYHSHPHSAPDPSDTDRHEAGYPNHLYLIVGLANDTPEVRLFVFEDGSFRRLSFDAE